MTSHILSFLLLISTVNLSGCCIGSFSGGIASGIVLSVIAVFLIGGWLHHGKARNRIIPALAFAILMSNASFSQDHDIKGFVGGGYIYNVRENDHGVWFEIGGKIKSIEAALNVSRMSDSFSFRELAAMGRYSLSRTFAIEGGYGWGAICAPAACGGPLNNVRTRTPIVGVMYHDRISRNLESVARIDVVHWQLHPTHGKDDGVRIFAGIRFGH